MARGNFPNPTERLDRRRLLAAALTAAGCAGVGAPTTEAKAEETIQGVPRQRPDSHIEGWNLGLISAHRPELTPAENGRRMGELRADIGNRFGRLLVRGRYIPESRDRTRCRRWTSPTSRWRAASSIWP